MGNDNTLHRFQQGSKDSGIIGSVILNASEGFDDTASLDLMIILSNHTFLAADVPSGENVKERLAEVLRLWE
jgi:hypothetical protein